MAFYGNKNYCIAPEVTFWLVRPLQDSRTHSLNIPQSSFIIFKGLHIFASLIKAEKKFRCEFCRLCLLESPGEEKFV